MAPCVRVPVSPASAVRWRPVFSYLYLQHQPCDGALHDVGSVEAVEAVDAEDAALFADQPALVDPVNSRQRELARFASTQQFMRGSGDVP